MNLMLSKVYALNMEIMRKPSYAVSMVSSEVKMVPFLHLHLCQQWNVDLLVLTLVGASWLKGCQ